MTRALGSGLGSVVLRRPHMKMLTGPHTSLLSQIPCLVNMEPVLPFG